MRPNIRSQVLGYVLPYRRFSKAHGHVIGESSSPKWGSSPIGQPNLFSYNRVRLVDILSVICLRTSRTSFDLLNCYSRISCVDGQFINQFTNTTEFKNKIVHNIFHGIHCVMVCLYRCYHFHVTAIKSQLAAIFEIF